MFRYIHFSRLENFMKVDGPPSHEGRFISKPSVLYQENSFHCHRSAPWRSESWKKSSHIFRWWLGCPITSSAQYLGSMKPFSEGEPGSLGKCILNDLDAKKGWPHTQETFEKVADIQETCISCYQPTITLHFTLKNGPTSILYKKKWYPTLCFFF